MLSFINFKNIKNSVLQASQFFFIKMLYFWLETVRNGAQFKALIKINECKQIKSADFIGFCNFRRIIYFPRGKDGGKHFFVFHDLTIFTFAFVKRFYRKSTFDCKLKKRHGRFVLFFHPTFSEWI